MYHCAGMPIGGRILCNHSSNVLTRKVQFTQTMCVSVCVHVCVPIHVHVCVSVCVHVCVPVHVHVCVCLTYGLGGCHDCSVFSKALLISSRNSNSERETIK